MLDSPWNGVTFTPPTAIDIATIEDAIVTQLNRKSISIEIAHYPDRPETWRLTHRVGAALVMYKGAQYGDLLDTATIIQERKLEFEISVMMRDLGWAVGGDPSGTSPGAYAIIEAIRTALTGFVSRDVARSTRCGRNSSSATSKAGCGPTRRHSRSSR